MWANSAVRRNQIQAAVLKLPHLIDGYQPQGSAAGTFWRIALQGFAEIDQTGMDSLASPDLQVQPISVVPN